MRCDAPGDIRHPTLSLSAAPAATLVDLAEGELAAARADADPVARHEFALQDTRRERVLDLLLDGALQRPRAVHRIEAGLAEQVARAVIERELDVALGQALAQVEQLDVDDGADLLGAEWMKHHDVVDAVDELGAEGLLYDLHHRTLHLGVVLLAGVLLNDLRAEVR